MSEWSKVHDWKSCKVKSLRGFESPSLRTGTDSVLSAPQNPARTGR